MKKLLFAFVALLFITCDDGDFDVPSFEFDNKVSSCGELILYVKNSSSTETLALKLNPDDIPIAEGTSELQITALRTANYRIYDDAIGSDYFCKDIPPTTPRVIKELNAESGIIVLNTVLIDSKPVHDISLLNLTFQDGQERIFFETFYFGEFSN